MSNGSPSAYLLWALLSTSFFTFMLVHLWNYDKFQCLRWDSGRQPGAFKRVMTYSYSITLPLLMLYSVAMAVLKFKEGYIMLEDGTICPRVFEDWQHEHLRWILPLYFVLSIAWSLELITHLEELTFWLFLLHQGPRKRDWFNCWEFRAWYCGSIVAVLGMPLTTLVKRADLDLTLPWIFVAGGSAGTFTTICFIYVLVTFPPFIRSVKIEGAEPDVVVRLTSFYHLNCIRVIFRFLFTVPLTILGFDGLLDSSLSVVSSPFWSDILLMTGGIGAFVSSAITLLVFFPRSTTSEVGYQAQDPGKRRDGASTPLPDYEHQPPSRQPSQKALSSIQTHMPNTHIQSQGDIDLTADPVSPHRSYAPSGSRSDDTVWDGTPKPGPSRRSAFAFDGAPIYVEEASSTSSYPVVHPYVMHFTSPIDLSEETSS